LNSRRRGGLPIAPSPARFCTREAVGMFENSASDGYLLCWQAMR
jgi:hypothetical protein